MSEVAEENVELLRAGEVATMCGVSKRSIWNWSSQGRFPQPLRLGERITRWRKRDVIAWIEGKGRTRHERRQSMRFEAKRK
jgi:prophage regulatory protein